jgi:hypothetical protein
VIDPEKNEGVVLVTANNPHLSRLPRSTAFCKDRCQELGWAKHLNNKDKVSSVPDPHTVCLDSKLDKLGERIFLEALLWIRNYLLRIRFQIRP